MSGLDSLESLYIFCSSLTNLNISELNLPNIRAIQIKKAICSLDTLVQISKCKNINRLEVENCVIFHEEGLDFTKSSDLNINDIYIKESAITKSNFDWFIKLKKNNALQLFNNVIQ